MKPRTMGRCFRILVGPRTNGGDCLNWKCWWLLYPSWPPGVLGRVVDLGHGVSHGRWWGPVWVLEELLFFKSLWWVPRPVVKPSKGLEELPYKESLVDSTASCETQYSFGRTSFFKSLWLDPWPVVNPSTGYGRDTRPALVLLFFKSLW